MNADRYQRLTRKTAVYPEQTAVLYLALGAADEGGEIAGAVKKHLRGDYDDDELESRVVSECGDVLWYVARLCDEFDVSLSEVLEQNADKVLDRQERGAIRGDGDTR
jgi:NTP pyrophosphatase (non-canonical NTP hydrolase)